MVEEQKDKSVIEEAQALAERIEAANKVQEENIKKLEALQARNILGGKSAAGEPQKVEPSKEEQLNAEMKKYFKGTVVAEAFK